MLRTKRHIAVFLLLLAAATVVSLLMPLRVDARDVFFYFMVAFVAYLALSYTAGWLQSRSAKS